MSRFSPLLTVMIRAAEKAARALRRDFTELEKLQVLRKGPADFVSQADKRSEQIIVEELHKARPTFQFLAEEGTSLGDGKDTSNRWIIDPLDGTSNFLSGIPHWAISIALERDGKPFAGVIFDPCKDEIFVAEKGSGAFCNNRRIKVSGRRELSDSIIGMGTPSCAQDSPFHDLFMKRLRAIMPMTSGTRRMGACSLDLAYVASGRYDGYWERGIKPWDMAAGIILIREANGKITDMSGGDDMFTKHELLCGNPHIYEEIRSVFRRVDKAEKAA